MENGSLQALAGEAAPGLQVGEQLGQRGGGLGLATLALPHLGAVPAGEDR